MRTVNGLLKECLEYLEMRHIHIAKFNDNGKEIGIEPCSRCELIEHIDDYLSFNRGKLTDKQLEMLLDSNRQHITSSMWKRLCEQAKLGF